MLEKEENGQTLPSTGISLQDCTTQVIAGKKIKKDYGFSALSQLYINKDVIIKKIRKRKFLWNNNEE